MIKTKLLTKNPYSRPGRASEMHEIKGIVLHWIASPKGTPLGVYNWFEGRKDGKNGYGSAHYCISIGGDIYQFIPDEEMAYHVGSKTYTDEAKEKYGSYPNNATIGIELCHLSWEGEFSDETWEQAKLLVTLLLKEHGLNIDNIDTHEKIVGWKECPRWFHLFPDEFTRFKDETKTLFDNPIYGTVTCGTLNVRDAVMGKKVGYVSKNDKVELIGIRNGWFKIKKGDLIGYASGDYITCS